MTIANEITRINNAKAAIKQSIENKGVSVSDTAKLDEYPALIDSISGEGGSVDAGYWPKFFELRTRNYTDLQYVFASMPVKNTDEDIISFIENFDTSKVKDIGNAFNQFGYSSSSYYPDLDLTKWDVEKVDNIKQAFYFCKAKNLNISGWKFTNTNALYQFIYYFYGTTVNASNCDTSNITNMSYCFGYSDSLVSLDITGWDTSKATTMGSMFYNDKKLVSITGEIDASSVTTFSSMFSNCNVLETVYLKNICKDSTVTNSNNFSINLGKTVVKDECLIYIINELPDLINDKGLTATDKIVLTLPPSNTLTEEQVAVAITKGWQVANVTYTPATYGLRRRMVYKAVECDEGAYQASDGSKYEIFEANNVVTPDGVAEWDEFSSIEDASEYYGLIYIGEQEDGQ